MEQAEPRLEFEPVEPRVVDPHARFEGAVPDRGETVERNERETEIDASAQPVDLAAEQALEEVRDIFRVLLGHRGEIDLPGRIAEQDEHRGEEKPRHHPAGDQLPEAARKAQPLGSDGEAIDPVTAEDARHYRIGKAEGEQRQEAEPDGVERKEQRGAFLAAADAAPARPRQAIALRPVPACIIQKHEDEHVADLEQRGADGIFAGRKRELLDRAGHDQQRHHDGEDDEKALEQLHPRPGVFQRIAEERDARDEIPAHARLGPEAVNAEGEKRQDQVSEHDRQDLQRPS